MPHNRDRTTNTLPSKEQATQRRIGSEQSAKRLLILDVTERLMLSEGYAAVSSRRVAKELDIKPSLVHYYFPTTDDLFIATFRRAAEEEGKIRDVAFIEEKSLQQAWDSYRGSRTALIVEFMALANHREAVRTELASYTEKTRKHRARLLADLLDLDAIQPKGVSPEALSFLLVSVSRNLVSEENLGISAGHADAKAFIEWWLRQLEA